MPLFSTPERAEIKSLAEKTIALLGLKRPQTQEAFNTDVQKYLTSIGLTPEVIKKLKALV